MKTNAAGLAILLGLIAGCFALEPAPEPTAESSQEIESCPWAVCSNSPEIAHYGLWEASVLGQRDGRGLSLRTWGGRAALKKGSSTYQLYVTGGRISGRSVVSKSDWISGQGLVGAWMEVLDSNGQTLYLISITAVRSLGVTFVVGAPDPVEVYTMRWASPSAIATSFSLCNAVLSQTADAKMFELLGMMPEETLVFEGDRIDAAAKTMSTTADDSWFNFGCAGHTLAKLYLTRNTIHSQPVDDWRQRQATLKMLTADYCGKGISFTLAGEPIAWKGGLLSDYPSGANLTSIDARWTAQGATCLVEPRIRSSSNPQAVTEFPDVLQEIYSHCALPSCMDLNKSSLGGALIVSVNREP